MRRLPRPLVLLLSLAVSCAPGAGTADIDLGDLGGGKADFSSIENLPIAIDAGGDLQLTLTAAGAFRVAVRQSTSVPLSLSVSGGGQEIDVAPSIEIDARIEAAASPASYTLVIGNHGDTRAVAELSLFAAPEQPASDELPGLEEPVVSDNEFCTYSDEIPYVASVSWSHPKIRAAMRRLGPGWRSMYTYYDWRVPYGLESDTSGSEEEQRNAKVRNFIRVLCGEYRDYPEMLEAKLDAIGQRQYYGGKDEVAEFDLDADLFGQLTVPAYERMTQVMGTMHSYRQQQLADANDGFHYGFGEHGHGSRRVEHSVAPWTHCEMKFMFSRFMIAGAPRVTSFGSDSDTQVSAATYEAQYADFRAASCTADDLDWMYNFRGHNNYKPLWLESNAYMWNSRRARKAEQNRDVNDYYLRPFASRHHRSRQALGAYLFYPQEHHADLIRASEGGGGPILYVTDQDTDGNLLADYRLFADDDGCGDQGVGSTNPSSNCNMVSWARAAAQQQTTGSVAGWDRSLWGLPDMGMFQVFGSFEERMARFNQALDRHTNWGPTSYYMIDASLPDAAADQIKMIGAYSPVVACSYDISASDFFARRDFVSNGYESGQLKWMFVMKFRASDYYDEADLRDGRPMDFGRDYFNETSMSNDYYRERALDHFGFIPPGDIHAIVYFVYGDRGDDVPALEDIPAPH